MKRIVCMFLALTAAAGFAAAQDEGIGLTAGLEFAFTDVAGDPETGIVLSLEYENSFLDGALDLYAGLAYDLAFSDPVAHGIGLEAEVAYNLSLAEASTLSFILNNETVFVVSPREDDSNNLEGILTPGINFTQGLDFGDLYAQMDFPITYVQPEKDADPGFGIDITVGWTSTFGLGIELTEHNALWPKGDVYGGLDLTVNYENGPIYAELALEAPGAFEGVAITPDFEYTFNAFTFYTSLEFGNINGEEGSVTISPAIGVKFSF
jgi:hypothetical protein